MHRRTLCVSLLVMSTVGFLPTVVQAAFAELTLQSQAGDYIGGGGSYDIIYGTSEISAQIRRSVAGGPAELLFVVGHVTPGPNTYSTLFFGTDQLGIPIQQGTYGLPGNTAQRADFASAGHAGLDVSFQNRGSNTLTGNFTVTDVSFYTDAFNQLQIRSFAASFEQHSEGATPALFGTFRYTSSVVPEPSSLVLIGVGGPISLYYHSRRRRTLS